MSTVTAPEFAAWCEAHRARVEAVLARVLPAGELSAGRLLEAMRYGALGGGKRLRALLAYASAEAVGAHAELADHAAVAVELIHAYSLIHDDLPCMDDDALRRGKPTNHVIFGEATAMLAGDAMQPLAFAVLAEMPAPAEGRIRAVAELAQASGAAGMAGGQAIDLANVGRAMTLEALTEMHRLKTGAMFEAAVVLPALALGMDGPTVSALRAFARPLGLAFQVIDDVLDATADTATLGKTAGKDAADAKPTFVSLLGIEAARAEAARLTEQAIAALEPLAALGRPTVRLSSLARAMGLRTH
jgi:farnesyl diphosphate synthase